MVQTETNKQVLIESAEIIFLTELQYSVVPPATQKTYPQSNNRCNPTCLRAFLLNFSKQSSLYSKISA